MDGSLYIVSFFKDISLILLVFIVHILNVVGLVNNKKYFPFKNHVNYLVFSPIYGDIICIVLRKTLDPLHILTIIYVMSIWEGPHGKRFRIYYEKFL
jgi:hypothetical protein